MNQYVTSNRPAYGTVNDDAASFTSEDLDTSNRNAYDTERSRIDERNRYSHLYQNDDEYMTKKNLTRCLIVALVILFFAIIIFAIANADGEHTGGGDVPDTWKPVLVDPVIGPYSSSLCEQYWNKNLTHPEPHTLSTFAEHEDWSLEEIWVYQENYHRKLESKWIITGGIQFKFANGHDIPEAMDEIPYFDFDPNITNITKVQIDTSKPIKSMQALAFCGIRLFDEDGNVLNSPEVWNTFWCPTDAVQWSDKVDFPEGTSLIGMTLGMAEVANY